MRRPARSAIRERTRRWPTLSMNRWPLTALLCSCIPIACKSPLERVTEERERWAATDKGADGGTSVLVPFHPPSNKTLIEHSVTRRTEVHTFQQQPTQSMVEAVEATMLSRYERADGGGWILSQQTRDLKVTRDGRPVENKLTALVESFPLKIRVSDDGAFVRLANPDDAQRAVQRVFRSPTEAESISQFFDPLQIEERARREWDGKYAGMFNHTLATTSAFYLLDSFVTSEGSQITYLLERRVSGTAKTSFGEAVVLSIRCVTHFDADAGQEAIQRSVPELDPSLLDPSVECTGQEMLARDPFFPVRSAVSVVATPEIKDGGTALRVTFEKQVEAVRLE